MMATLPTDSVVLSTSVTVIVEVKPVAASPSVKTTTPPSMPARTGASLTALTVIETVAGAESADPSFTLNVKLSAPA
jgi:hypothetical protein